MSGAPPRLAMIGFRAGPGGIGRVMTTLIAALIEHGIAVDLLLPPGSHPDLAPLEGRVGIWSVDGADEKAARAVLAGYLRKRRPDAILSNRDQSHRLLAGGFPDGERPFTAFRIGTNVLEKIRRNSPLTGPWKRRRLARLYREADCLIGISPGVSAALQRMLGRAGGGSGARPGTATIWNPLDLAAIRRMAAEPLGHPWFTPKAGPVVVSVGRLVRAKNYSTLLRAFGQLPEALDARLVIVGAGGQHGRLRGLARDLGLADRIDLPGYQANPFPYVAAADLFVCSSIFEGANNALIEALTLGTPVVSTDCPSGPREILDDGKLGALVPVEDVPAMAVAIRSALESPIDPQGLRASAARFDPHQAARRYAEVLGLIGRPAEGGDAG